MSKVLCWVSGGGVGCRVCCDVCSTNRTLHIVHCGIMAWHDIHL